MRCHTCDDGDAADVTADRDESQQTDLERL